MADDPTQRHGQDRTRINTDQDHEIRYWTKELGVSEDELTEAVRIAATRLRRSGSTWTSSFAMGAIRSVKAASVTVTALTVEYWTRRFAIDEATLRETVAYVGTFGLMARMTTA
jgi:hypothetical protein